MTVTVPEAFRAIGYSGDFHLHADMTMSPDEVEQWRTKVPCLLRQAGWMALAVTDTEDGPLMVVVRRDADALWDLMITGGPWQRPPAGV